jgi:hypothetical protein
MTIRRSSLVTRMDSCSFDCAQDRFRRNENLYSISTVGQHEVRTALRSLAKDKVNINSTEPKAE